MSRIAGRNARLMVDIAGTGTAAVVPYIKSFNHDLKTDRYDVTAYGDNNKAYVQGLPDAQGTYAGFYDDATQQFFTAAVDGNSRRTYFYPNFTGAPTKYEYGFAFFDSSEDFPVDGPGAISGSWAADGAWQKSF